MEGEMTTAIEGALWFPMVVHGCRTYTADEAQHFEDLRLDIWMVHPDEDLYNTPNYWRSAAAEMREVGPWADAENGPRESDLDYNPDALDELADELECGMERGEQL